MLKLEMCLLMGSFEENIEHDYCIETSYFKDMHEEKFYKQIIVDKDHNSTITIIEVSEEVVENFIYRNEDTFREMLDKYEE